MLPIRRPPRLRVLIGGRWKPFLLSEGEQVIGRSKADCQVVLPSSELSRVHCSILVDNGEHFIMDLGSSNKTRRNGHCLRPNVFYELTDGCELTLADMRCKYYKVWPAPPEDTDSPPRVLDSESSGYSGRTEDYEFDPKMLTAASSKEKADQDINVDPVVSEDVDEGGSSTHSENSPMLDTTRTPAVTRPDKKHVMFQAVDPNSASEEKEDACGLSEPTMHSSLEGEGSENTSSPPLLQQQSAAKPLSPTMAYHDQASPTVPYHDPPSPTIPYHDPPSPTVPYHDPPSPTIHYRDQPSPTVAYHDQPSPTVAYHDPPSPNVRYHDQPSPTVVYDGPPSPTVPYQQASTDSDKLDMMEDDEQLHRQSKDLEPTVPYQIEEEEENKEEERSPDSYRDAIGQSEKLSSVEGLFGKVEPSVDSDRVESRHDHKKEDAPNLCAPATSTSSASFAEGAQAPDVSSGTSKKRLVLSKTRKGSKKVATRAKKSGPKYKNNGISPKTDSASADVISDESPDLQSSSISVPATSVDADEAIQPSGPKKKITLRKVKVSCSKSLPSKAALKPLGNDANIKMEKEPPAVDTDVPVASSSHPLPSQSGPCVMFTGMIDEAGSQTVCELGGSLAGSVFECTHLITDKVRRTVKFLCCMAQGCLIVSPSWLKDCRAKKRLVPAEPFLVHDRAAEKQYGFKLNISLSSAKESPLLAGWEVFTTENVKPTCTDMKEIISCAGGQVLSSLPVVKTDKVVVITCEEDSVACEAARDAGIPVCSTELILGGILRQQLDIEQHLLASPVSSGTGTTKLTQGKKRKASSNAGGSSAVKKKKR